MRPVDQVAALHAQHVAQEGELNQWRGLVSDTAEMNISPVVMLDGRVAGILLGKLEGTTAVVHTRVVAPGYQGSWVNVTLLAKALEIGWAHGARRARFLVYGFKPRHAEAGEEIPSRDHQRDRSVCAHGGPIEWIE